MLYFYVLNAVMIWRVAPRHDQLVLDGDGSIFYGAAGGIALHASDKL